MKPPHTPVHAGRTDRGAARGPATLRRYVTALRPDWDAALISGFVYMEGGYSNDNFRFEYGGERYVLRAPGAPGPFVDRQVEQRLYAAQSEVMPRVVAFDAASGCMITRWEAGPLLADRQPRADDLVDYVCRLHDCTPDAGRVYDPLAQARLHLESASAPRAVEALAGRLHWSPEQQVPCHNDLNPWNVICSPDDGWITLDWEWAGSNDPLFDLVTLHQGAGMPAAVLHRMASRYAGAPVPEARLANCLTVFWLRELTWALAEIAAGNDRPEIREQARTGLARLGLGEASGR